MCTSATAYNISETAGLQKTGFTYHVGKENPADEASRGLTAKELLESNRWFNGPQFLWQEDPLPLQPQPVYTLLPSDNEVRKDRASTLATKIDKVKIRQVSPGVLEPDRLNHFSSYNRLKRCIVRLQRAIEKLRPNKQMNWRPKNGPPLVAELSRAEPIILKFLQHHHFEPEMKALRILTVTKTNLKIARRHETETTLSS